MGFRLAKLANRSTARVFGEAVTYTPAGGSPVPLRAIVDQEPVREAVGQGDAWESSEQVTATIVLADWPQVPAPDDELATADAAYVVRDVRADGQGGVVLVLSRQFED